MKKTQTPMNDEMMEWACFDGDEAIYDPSDQQMDIYKEAVCTNCGKVMFGFDCTKRCYQNQKVEQLVKPHISLFENYMG